MIPIYVIHHDKLVNRRTLMEGYLEHYKRTAPVTWVDQYSYDNLTDEMKTMYEPDKQTWDKQCQGLYNNTPNFEILEREDVSRAIGHIKTLENIRDGIVPVAPYLGTMSLIIEDNVIFTDDFYKYFYSALSCPPTKWDLIFIGGKYSHDIAPTIGSIPRSRTPAGWLQKGSPATNSVCSYIVNKRSATILAKKLQKFTLPIDLAMNYVIKEENMTVWHIQPYIIQKRPSGVKI